MKNVSEMIRKQMDSYQEGYRTDVDVNNLVRTLRKHRLTDRQIWNILTKK